MTTRSLRRRRRAAGLRETIGRDLRRTRRRRGLDRGLATARNGRDWHTLLEFCGLVGTLIVDEDGVYDPRHPNDRLLLGMKGTMSEMELSLCGNARSRP